MRCNLCAAADYSALSGESRHFCTKNWCSAILNAASGELVIGRVDFQINFIILSKLKVAGFCV